VVENLEWYDIFRVFTILFSSVGLYISARKALQGWRHYTRRLQELVWAVQAFLILMIEGSLEAIIRGLEGGPRTVLSLIVSAVFLRAVSRDEGYLIDEKEI